MRNGKRGARGDTWEVGGGRREVGSGAGGEKKNIFKDGAHTRTNTGVIHHSQNHGEPFRLLGPTTDTKLTMGVCITKICSKGKPKLKARIRTLPYYSTHELTLHFKTHLLPLLETSIGAVYHAATTHLDKLDAPHYSRLHVLNMSSAQAFLDHNLPPPNLRRDIAMLGLLFKISKGLAHPDFHTIFHRHEPPTHTYLTRFRHRYHCYALREYCKSHTHCNFNTLYLVWCTCIISSPHTILHTIRYPAFKRRSQNTLATTHVRVMSSGTACFVQDIFSHCTANPFSIPPRCSNASTRTHHHSVRRWETADARAGWLYVAARLFLSGT